MIVLNLKSSLGLPTSIHNNPSLYDDQKGRNFIINSFGKGEDHWLSFAGTRVKEAMIKLNQDKDKVARLIEQNFNDSKKESNVRKTPFAYFGTNPGGVDNFGSGGKKYSLNDLQDLMKIQDVEMENKKRDKKRDRQRNR